MKSPLFLTLPAERKKSELGESLPDVTERSSHLRVYSIRYVELDHKGVKTSLKPSSTHLLGSKARLPWAAEQAVPKEPPFEGLLPRGSNTSDLLGHLYL